ncbi:MAG TPA: hypothetical protein VMU54_06125 [Planctomycetota bacterium]|nr:hypothetical protein [Planctomycetota bacterium]
MIQPARKESGSALLLSLICIIIVGGLAGAYLSLSYGQSKTTFGATQSDMAFHTAEAGIDDAINKMNAYAQASGSQAGLPQNADFAVIGTAVASPTGNGTVNLVNGTVNGGTYSVEISPIYAGRGTYTLSSTGVHGTSRRGIRTVVHPNASGGAFAYGLFGDTGITGSGGIYTDGYSSSKTLPGTSTPESYAQQAINTANGKSYADSTGSVGTNQSITLSGNATIFGNASPGPNGTVSQSGNVMVQGSTAPAPSTVVNPVVNYAPPSGLASQGSLSLNGQGTTTLTAGTYLFDSISTSGQSTLALTGNVTLYLNGDLSVSGGSTLQLNPPANVTIYQSSAGKISISGGGLVNQTQLASNFQVYSASTTSVDVSGNTDFFGAVYAPKATFKPSGTAAFFGSFIAGNVQISGGATFHYDEDLGKQPSSIPVYKVLSWGEFAP